MLVAKSMMKIEHRQYQADACEEAANLLKHGKRPLLRAATGSGKTEMGFMIKRALGARRTLWLVPGDVLLEQTATRASGNGFGAAHKWPPSQQWSQMTDVMVVTPRTAWNRYESGHMQNGDAPDLLVIDEAHHAYTSVDPRHKEPQVSRLAKALGVPTLGLTATPWRLSDRQGFDELFDTLVETPSINELVEQGHLAPLRLVVPQSMENRVHGGATQNGEYTSRGIEQHNDQQIYTRRAIAMLQDAQGDLSPADWKQSIVYAVSLGHAVKLANMLAELGVPTGFISSRGLNEDEDRLHSSVQEDRYKAVDEFKAGKLRVVVNYAIVTEGFDLAGAEIVLITRPTLSLALYRQMCGRATRKMDGKTEGVVIDCTDNWSRFGGPMSQDRFQLEPRENTYEAGSRLFDILCNRPPTRDENGNQSVCGTIIPNARVQTCPACDHPQGRLCQRCGTFRRTEHYIVESMPDACDRCIEDERQRVRAETVVRKNYEEVGKRLYEEGMVQTQKARFGKAGDGSRWGKHTTERDGKKLEVVYGVKERLSDGAWRPWTKIDNEFLGGRPAFEKQDEALRHLLKTLHKANVMPEWLEKHYELVLTDEKKSIEGAPQTTMRSGPAGRRRRPNPESIARPSRAWKLPKRPLSERLAAAAEREKKSQAGHGIRW